MSEQEAIAYKEFFEAVDEAKKKLQIRLRELAGKQSFEALKSLSGLLENEISDEQMTEMLNDR